MSVHWASAPAKVNLTLAVGDRRADGYHDLSTVMVRLGLADRVTVRPAAGPPPVAAGDRLAVTGLPVSAGADNLVLRDVAALRVHAGGVQPPLDLALHKVVPLAAGLGGGSSDAAAAAAVAARAWGLALDRRTRLAVAAQVGSDVPFFALDAPAAWATRRGERLAALPVIAGEPACLLAVSATGAATADVFAALDRMRAADGGTTRGRAAETTASLAAALRTGLDAAALVARAAELRDANDLWAALAVLRPDVARWRDALEVAAGRPWLLSGSGPTLFALYASLAEARGAAERLARRPRGRPDGARLIATPLGAVRRRSIESEGAS